MKKHVLFIFYTIIILSGCASKNYYIVRHAEKENFGNDPGLNQQGKKRAEILRDKLAGLKIGSIYSTNTTRTRSTAEPLSKLINVPVQLYAPVPDSSFINQVKNLKKNVLIVGHSNTVDDIVNLITGEKKINGDVPESEYDNLFIITYKGKKIFFSHEKY